MNAQNPKELSQKLGWCVAAWLLISLTAVVVMWILVHGTQYEPDIVLVLIIGWMLQAVCWVAAMQAVKSCFDAVTDNPAETPFEKR